MTSRPAGVHHIAKDAPSVETVATRNMSRRAARVHGAGADNEYDLQHMANMIACLTAVRLDKQGDLAPRQRIGATRALDWLVHFARGNMPGEVLASMTMDESVAARVALVQVYSVALRAVSEAGGAAIAAGGHNRPTGSQRKHANVPSASSAAGWVETLQYSSDLIHCMLHSTAMVDTPPAPDARPNGGPHDGVQTAFLLTYRRACFKVVAAMLRSDALSALSRLLAAEQHRGTAAVLGMGATVDILWPVVDLADIGRRYPGKLLSLGDCQDGGQQQQPQPQLLGPAVLRALAASGVVEHVCRFAVTRLARPARGTERAAGEFHKHASVICGLAEEVSLLACEALIARRGDAADAWAVLLSPCLQVGRCRAWRNRL